MRLEQRPVWMRLALSLPLFWDESWTLSPLDLAKALSANASQHSALLLPDSPEQHAGKLGRGWEEEYCIPRATVQRWADVLTSSPDPSQRHHGQAGTRINFKTKKAKIKKLAPVTPCVLFSFSIFLFPDDSLGRDGWCTSLVEPPFIQSQAASADLPGCS